MIQTLLKAGRRQRLARLCLLPGGKQQNPNQTAMKLRPIQLKETATENIGQRQLTSMTRHSPDHLRLRLLCTTMLSGSRP